MPLLVSFFVPVLVLLFLFMNRFVSVFRVPGLPPSETMVRLFIVNNTLCYLSGLNLIAYIYKRKEYGCQSNSPGVRHIGFTIFFH